MLKTLMVAIMLLNPISATAAGGSDPIPGIDVIMKEDPTLAKTRFSPKELDEINELKGMEKPALIAKFVARRVEEFAKGAQPKGGWYAVISKGLMAEWCAKCSGGTTRIKVETPKSDVPIEIIIKIGK